MNATTDITYSPKDYKSDQYVRWCPGCGDHAVLSCLHKAMAEVGTSPDNMAVISGIGCSSRLPYYMNSYGFHTIHGRGAAIATGVKTARPDISVWLVTGDGDCLAIGGNHFIHAVRRNVDLNVVLMNNKIYGLTKGQYSPTSDRGFVSKSSPYGTVEDPFVPAELTLGARGNFFARGIDTDAANLTAIFAASARHRGAAVTEVLVNCVIFNILVHDAHERDNTLHLMLAMMNGDLPVALGIIRDVDAPTYDESVHQQIAEVKAKKKAHSLRDMLLSGDTWEVK